MIKLNDPRITAYLLGELAPAEVEVIEQALRSSPALAKNVEQMRQTIELLKLALPEENQNDLFGDMNLTSNEKTDSDSVNKALSSSEKPDNRWRRFFYKVFAALAIGAGVYLLLQPKTQPIYSPDSPEPSQLSTQTNGSEIEIDPQITFVPFDSSQEPKSIENTWEDYGLSSQQIENLSQVSASPASLEMNATVLFPAQSVNRTEFYEANCELHNPNSWIAKAYGSTVPNTDYSDKLIVENPIEYANVKPKSSFELCPHDASWQVFHQAITQSNSLPSAQSVRVEQYVNHFRYSLPQPEPDKEALSISVQVGRCPWAPGMLLAKIGIRAQSGEADKIAARNASAEVSFNPALIKAYRLIGYEKALSSGNSTSSQSVPPTDVSANSESVVLYELALNNPSDADVSHTNQSDSSQNFWFSVDVVYTDVQTESIQSKTFHTYPQPDSVLEQTALNSDFQFAAAVALFAQLLQKSEYSGTGTFDTVVQLLKDSLGDDAQRKDFENLVLKTIELTKKQADK